MTIYKIIATVAAAAALAGCHGGKTRDGESARTDSLETAIAIQDTLLATAFGAIETIVANQQTIHDQGEMIEVQLAQKEFGADEAARVASRIAALDTLSRRNRAELGTLLGCTSEGCADLTAHSLQNLLIRITAQAGQQEALIDALRNSLKNKHIQSLAAASSIGTLEQRSREIEQQAQAAGALLHTAYYTDGTQRDLLREGVIDRNGFIGRRLSVNENHSLNGFNSVDTRSFTRMRLTGRDPMLVSTHPATSWRITSDKDGGQWLTISDPAAFWKYTKVLVIAYK